MPLFPTLIKYMDSLGVVVRTVFFKTSKLKDGGLFIVDSDSKESLPVIQQKALKAFRKMLKDE
jgi:hypothetical protein